MSRSLYRRPAKLKDQKRHPKPHWKRKKGRKKKLPESQPNLTRNLEYNPERRKGKEGKEKKEKKNQTEGGNHQNYLLLQVKGSANWILTVNRKGRRPTRCRCQQKSKDLYALVVISAPLSFSQKQIKQVKN